MIGLSSGGGHEDVSTVELAVHLGQSPKGNLLCCTAYRPALPFGPGWHRITKDRAESVPFRRPAAPGMRPATTLPFFPSPARLASVRRSGRSPPQILSSIAGTDTTQRSPPYPPRNTAD